MQHPLPTKAGYTCVGVVIGAHGIRGQVKLKSFTVIPEHMAAYGPLSTLAGNALTLTHIRPAPQPNLLIGSLSGVTSRTHAEQFAHTPIYVPTAAIPRAADEQLYATLVGTPVKNSENEIIGTVEQVFSNGAQDILEIQSGEKRVLVPYVEQYVASASAGATGAITLTPDAAQFWEL